jgi:hypothetical protein
MCDPEMFTALFKDVRAGVKGKQRTAQMYMYQTVQEQMRSQWKGGKPPCKTCFIYLEHQRLKHRFLAPLTYPFTALLLWLLYPTLQRVYRVYSPKVAQWWATISFSVSQPGNPLEQAAPLSTATDVYTFYAFVFVFGLLLLMLVIRSVEVVVLKWKW